jgi:hypothetical protein
MNPIARLTKRELFMRIVQADFKGPREIKGGIVIIRRHLLDFSLEKRLY